MPQSHGFDNTVVFGKETTYGQLATNFDWIGIIESFEPEETSTVDVRRSVGVRAPFMLRQGGKEVDASVSVALQNGRLLAYALGHVSTSGTAAPYTHTIRPVEAGEELPSLSVKNHNALHDFTRDYLGGFVDTITITASAEEAVMCEAEMMFKEVVDGGSPVTVTAELENYFMFYESSVSINGIESAAVTEFELELANGLERRFALNGEQTPARITKGALEITASLTLDFIGTEQWENFKNGSTMNITLTLQDSADVDHKIIINLIGGMYETHALGVSAEDLQEQELEAIFTDISVVVTDSNATLI